MTIKAQLTLRKTLDNLRKLGPAGCVKEDILDLAELASGTLTSAERDALWELLVERRYIAGHFEPVTDTERWAITERGLTALAAL